MAADGPAQARPAGRSSRRPRSRPVGPALTDDLATRLSGRTAVITGGLGFIGSTLARRLVAEDVKVTIVDSLVPGHGGSRFNIAGLEGQVVVDTTDMRDGARLGPLLEGCDVVFNLAGQSSHLDSMSDPLTDLDINCRAQLSLLEACRRHAPKARIVFASTRQVYGRPIRVPVAEDHPLRPVDINGVNKMAGEWYHLLYDRVHDLHGSILRLTNTYGPRMRVRDARQTFLGIWIRCVVQGRPFEVWGGEQRRDLCYVDDVVDALLLAATEGRARGEIFNLGNVESVSLLELARMLVDLSGGGEYVVQSFPEERVRIDIGDYVADWAKIRTELGWSPRVTLRDGLQRTIAYYREHGAHYWDDA